MISCAVVFDRRGTRVVLLLHTPVVARVLCEI